MTKQKMTITIIIAFIGLLLGLWGYKLYVNRGLNSIHDMQATVLTQPRPLQPFFLQSAQGKFDLQSLKGHWSMLFFGFTHCPDICPTTMAILNQMVENIKAQDQLPPRIIMVSVDSKRDTPKKLQAYVAYFNKAFIGITGSRKQIDNITQQLGIAYHINNAKGEDNYTVDHSGAIILIDPQQRMHAIFSDNSNPQQMAQEFITIKKLAK
jgi:protein SCO1/2